MIKNLTATGTKNLLEIINQSWAEETLPESWKKAIIIPIPKPNKDPQLTNSYRPIALTSCMSKIMKKMITSRLSWYFERNKLFNEYQSGF